MDVRVYGCIPCICNSGCAFVCAVVGSLCHSLGRLLVTWHSCCHVKKEGSAPGLLDCLRSGLHPFVSASTGPPGLGFTLCYAILLPGRRPGFRAGFRPDSNQESLKIGPPGGLRPAGGPNFRLSLVEPAEIRPGSPISGPEPRSTIV